jgi:hypothetical protein
MWNRIDKKVLIQKSDRDSLIIHSDNSVKRFHRNRICVGTWKLNSDSTKIVFTFPDCSSYYYPYGAEQFILETLTENSVKMLCDMGEEGELTERFFKPAVEKVK